MITIVKNLDLKPFSTCGVGGKGKYVINATSVQDVKDAVSFAGRNKLPIHVLGEGSNTIFSDGILAYVFLKMNIQGMVEKRVGNEVLLDVCAGVHWDDFVNMTVESGLCGVEALSAIPGSVGATPFQNVGAYGVEVSDVIEEVHVYDLQGERERRLSNSKCHFRYRDSIFKSEERGRYIILSVVFRLSKGVPEIPRYEEIQGYFRERNVVNPSLKEIRKAIMDIRTRKLPDPSVVPNAGSFFKNPIVLKSEAEHLKALFPDMKLHDAQGGVKIAAGWLVEKAVGKRARVGVVETWRNNALVLTILEKGTKTKEVLKAQKEIEQKVRTMFGIQLEREPILVD